MTTTRWHGTMTMDNIWYAFFNIIYYSFLTKYSYHHCNDNMTTWDDNDNRHVAGGIFRPKWRDMSLGPKCVLILLTDISTYLGIPTTANDSQHCRNLEGIGLPSGHIRPPPFSAPNDDHHAVLIVCFLDYLILFLLNILSASYHCYNDNAQLILQWCRIILGW